jgi:hypothetical protein
MGGAAGQHVRRVAGPVRNPYRPDCLRPRIRKRMPAWKAYSPPEPDEDLRRGGQISEVSDILAFSTAGRPTLRLRLAGGSPFGGGSPLRLSNQLVPDRLRLLFGAAEGFIRAAPLAVRGIRHWFRHVSPRNTRRGPLEALRWSCVRAARRSPCTFTIYHNLPAAPTSSVDSSVGRSRVGTFPAVASEKRPGGPLIVVFAAENAADLRQK